MDVAKHVVLTKSAVPFRKCKFSRDRRHCIPGNAQMPCQNGSCYILVRVAPQTAADLFRHLSAPFGGTGDIGCVGKMLHRKIGQFWQNNTETRQQDY